MRRRIDVETMSCVYGGEIIFPLSPFHVRIDCIKDFSYRFLMFIVIYDSSFSPSSVVALTVLYKLQYRARCWSRVPFPPLTLPNPKILRYNTITFKKMPLFNKKKLILRCRNLGINLVIRILNNNSIHLLCR